MLSSQKLSAVISKIGRAYHNANLATIPSYTNAFPFVILSEKQLIFNLFVITLKDVKNKKSN